MSMACGPLTLTMGWTHWVVSLGCLLTSRPSDRPTERTGLRSPDTAVGSPQAPPKPALAIPFLCYGQGSPP